MRCAGLKKGKVQIQKSRLGRNIKDDQKCKKSNEFLMFTSDRKDFEIIHS